jgi:replication factor A1
MSWCRFKVNCIVTDDKDVINFFLSGKTAENFFNASAHHLVYDKKYVDPYTVPPQMTEVLNKMKIFQLRFGAYKSAINRCDIFVTNVFDEGIKQSSEIQSEQFGARSSTTLTTITIEDSSIVQADTLTPITPPDSTPPSQQQEDSYRLKAKKSLDFTDPHSEKM